MIVVGDGDSSLLSHCPCQIRHEWGRHRQLPPSIAEQLPEPADEHLRVRYLCWGYLTAFYVAKQSDMYYTEALKSLISVESTVYVGDT